MFQRFTIASLLFAGSLALACSDEVEPQDTSADVSREVRPRFDSGTSPTDTGSSGAADVPTDSDGSVGDVAELSDTDDLNGVDVLSDVMTEPDTVARDTAAWDWPDDVDWQDPCASLSSCQLGGRSWCEGDTYATCDFDFDLGCSTFRRDCGRSGGITCEERENAAHCVDFIEGGDTCDEAVVLEDGTLEIATTSYTNTYEEYRGDCDWHQNIWGSDRVFSVVVPPGIRRTVTATPALNINLILVEVADCFDVIAGCLQYLDEGWDGIAETMAFENRTQDSETRLVIIDGWGLTDFGRVGLTVTSDPL